MNIFILDTDPAIAASYHSDQHLHKMILESAQMLSTAMWNLPRVDPLFLQDIYKPAYPKHPCTLWVCQSNHNALWLCELAFQLENIRQSLTNCTEHSSTPIVRLINHYLSHEFPLATYYKHTEFVFAGPPTIAINSTLSITQKYQKYYRQKHAQWLLDKGAGMSYKNRPIPPFMAGLF